MQGLVVGCTIGALRYAFEHDMPLVYLKPQPPHRFTGDVEEWHHLYFCLSMAGLIKFGDKVSQIRVSDNGLRITVGHAVHEVESSSIFIFDDKSVEGLPPPERGNPVNEVLDWIDVRSGMKHDFHRIHIYNSDFIVGVNFYPSDRIDGKHDLMDACTISYLTDEQLGKFEYSELVTRLKTEEIMRDAGIKGAGNGAGRHLPIRLESRKREVFPKGVNIYSGLPSGFKVMEKSSVKYPLSKSSYLNYLIKGVARDREW
tara:strand:- start:1542 stop:2312 length:771 start_codon:yes stop_codon:yes gene_type:complete